MRQKSDSKKHLQTNSKGRECEVVEMYNLQPRAAAATSDVRA